LLAATELIVGKVENCATVNIIPDENMDEAEAEIGKAIQKVDTGAGVLILTDLFGGTPSNLSLSFLKEGRIEVLSGVNLPMVLTLATNRSEKSLMEVAEMTGESGRNNIRLASRILNIKTETRKKEN